MKDVTGWDRCAEFSPTFDDRGCLYYIEQHGGKACGLCKRPDTYRCLNETSRLPIPLSFSSVNHFLTCHRLFELQDIMGLKVKDAELGRALKMGALWDTALQYALGNTEVSMQAVIDRYSMDEMDIEKVRALYRAYKDLEIAVEPGYSLQAKIDLEIEFPEHWVWGSGLPIKLAVRGFYDRKYPTYFAENKLSGRPNNYLDPFFIRSQVGTYFLADESLESCVMEVVRTPDLKPNKFEEGNPEAYGDRTYKDIMGRPSHYFLGFERGKRTYGRRYYRTEFDLDELRSRYLHVFREIHEAAMLDGFYRNDRACGAVLPGIPCEYVEVCRYNKPSEVVFEVRTKDIE